MVNPASSKNSPPDLLSGVPLRPRRREMRRRPQPLELTTARVLCRQLRRQRTRPDKQRVAHLICLNLLSMLKRSGVSGGGHAPRQKR